MQSILWLNYQNMVQQCPLVDINIPPGGLYVYINIHLLWSISNIHVLNLQNQVATYLYFDILPCPWWSQCFYHLLKALFRFFSVNSDRENRQIQRSCHPLAVWSQYWDSCIYHVRGQHYCPSITDNYHCTTYCTTGEILKCTEIIGTK